MDNVINSLPNAAEASSKVSNSFADFFRRAQEKANGVIQNLGLGEFHLFATEFFRIMCIALFKSDLFSLIFEKHIQWS